jgi:hypothetical protein
LRAAYAAPAMLRLLWFLQFLRRPFTWLVVAEVVVVGGLAAATAHVFAGRVAPPRAAAAEPLPLPLPATGESPGPGASPPSRAAPRPTASPGVVVAVATPTPRRLGPTPGLDTSAGFLGARLKAINRDESAWERSEWTIIQAVLGFARAYIDGVVLPGVRAAEERAG